MKTSDLMTRDVVVVTPDHSVRHAAQIIYERGISGLPVVDSQGVLVGLITEGDLLRRVEIGPPDGAEILWRHFASSEGLARDYVKTHSWRVGDVMTSPVVSVGETTPLRRVAELLETRGIRRLPVVRAGKLVGIISRGDLLRCLAEQLPEQPVGDDEAMRICLEARFRDAEGILKSQPEVSVVQGVVHLWGELGSSAERDVARVVVDSVPGTRGLEDHTTISRQD